jgi:hypothetical protein
MAIIDALFEQDAFAGVTAARRFRRGRPAASTKPREGQTPSIPGTEEKRRVDGVLARRKGLGVIIRKRRCAHEDDHGRTPGRNDDAGRRGTDEPLGEAMRLATAILWYQQ